jgi:16S rRNA processing protein RimM
VFDNSNNQELGKIVGFSTNNAQDLLQVSDGKISFYVPFIEAFVKKIDYKTRQIYLDLPEGLIEVQQK